MDLGQGLYGAMAYDLEGSSASEIITGTAGGDVVVLDGDTCLEIRHLQIAGGIGGSISAVAVDDLDHDGGLEIVVGSDNGHAYALNAGLTTVLWTSPSLGGVVQGITLADLDGDGFPEILAGQTHGYLYIFDGVKALHDPDNALEYDSGPDPQWGALWGAGDLGSHQIAITVADADDDGELEILIQHHYTVLTALYPANRTVKWVSGDLGEYIFGIAVGDVDGDHRNEIVVGEYSGGCTPTEGTSNGCLYVLDGRTRLPKWNKTLPGHVGSWQAVVLRDWDLDGVVDIFTGTSEGYVYVFNGVTRAPEWRSDDLGSNAFGLDVADVDGDGMDEIVVGVEGGTVTVFGQGGSPTQYLVNYAASGCQIRMGQVLDGRVLALDFDEGQGSVAIDDSGYGNDGSILGGAVFVSGVRGTALQFDGTDDRVEVPNDPSLLPGTGDFTVTMWIRTTAAARQVLIQNGHDGFGESPEYFFHLLPEGVIYGVTDTPYVSADVLAGPTPVNDGQWHFVAFSRDTLFRLYVDGNLDATAPQGDRNIMHGLDILLGSRIGYWYFQGAMDEVRVYDRSLTPEEIASEGRLSPIELPADEWVDAGATPGGIFPPVVYSADGRTRCLYLSDDRSAVSGPARVTATYKTQYIVAYASSGCVLPVSVPDGEWVDEGALPSGQFPAVVTATVGLGPGAVTLDGTVLPTAGSPAWSLEGYPAQLAAGGYIDYTRPSGVHAYYYLRDGTLDNNLGSVMEARIRVVSGTTSQTAAYFDIRDGTRGVGVAIRVGSITEYGDVIPLDTTSDFRLYRLELQGSLGRVFVDGVKVWEGVAPGASDQWALFAAGTSSAEGPSSALFDYVSYTRGIVPSGDARSRCGLLFDDRAPVIGPVTVTAAYKTQYLVEFVAAGCVLPVAVPSDEWIDAGALPSGQFPGLVVGQDGLDPGSVVLDGTTLPTSENPPWPLEGHPAALSGGGFIDYTRPAGVHAYYYLADPLLDPVQGVTMEARIMVIAGSPGTTSAFLDVRNGVRIANWHIRIDDMIFSDGHVIPFSPTGAFHTYRMILQGTEMWYYVDGQLVYQATAPLYGGHLVLWGAGTSSAQGASSALFDYVSYTRGLPVSPKTRCLFLQDDRGPVSAPSVVTGTYTTQYLVDYLVTGCALTVPIPEAEWVDVAETPTGAFPASFYSPGGGTRCLFVSDDRGPVGGPTTVTAAYETQYSVAYAATGCALDVEVPSAEWVDSGEAPAGSFPVSVYSEDGRTRCLFLQDDRGPITVPTTVTGTYQTQFRLTLVSLFGTSPADTPSILGGEGLGSPSSGTLTAWFDSLAEARVNLEVGIDTSFSPPIGFVGWTGDAQGLFLTSEPILMDGPKTATAQWVSLGAFGDVRTVGFWMHNIGTWYKVELAKTDSRLRVNPNAAQVSEADLLTMLCRISQSSRLGEFQSLPACSGTPLDALEAAWNLIRTPHGNEAGRARAMQQLLAAWLNLERGGYSLSTALEGDPFGTYGLEDIASALSWGEALLGGGPLPEGTTGAGLTEIAHVFDSINNGSLAEAGNVLTAAGP